jgi:hypothetical protein
MGEILRLSGEYDGAIKCYEKVDSSAGLPTELVAKMKEFALYGNKSTVRLPPHIVGIVFNCARPVNSA